MSMVARPARTRLLEAVLAELVEKGYPALEIGAAAQRARLVDEEWSARFPDKDACLVAAFDELCEQLREAVVAGCLAAEGEWSQRVAGGLRALLDELSDRSEMAEALARSFPALGPAAQRRYQAFLEGLAPLLQEGRRHVEDGLELPEGMELLAIGAVETIVFEQIQRGRGPLLRALAPQILFSVLVPFLGPERAGRAMEEERARRLEPA